MQVGSFKNPSAMITSLSDLCFRFRRFLLVQTKKVISRLASPNNGTLRSPKTNTLADGLIEITSSMLDETPSKAVHNFKEGNR